MSIHLQRLARHVNGWLVPGSTGDGWEMSDDEVFMVLDHVLGIAKSCQVRVLIGVLRTDTDSIVAQIRRISDWLCDRTAESDPVAALWQSSACGFTVCPPAGNSLSQSEIRAGLEAVLALRFPTALYQLPQVTGNEMSAATVASLAEHYPNFFLFKDTSGSDRVALSGEDLWNVFLVRGAEGEYAKWPKTCGGPYDGFLLSTANCFAADYAAMLDLLDGSQRDAACSRIAPVERAVTRSFEAVKEFRGGNPFTNANKAIDQFMAFGPNALTAPSPRLHCGVSLDGSILEPVGQALQDNGLLPRQGYMSG
jgi:dihydrodipicolinate synthase/N-acetylneuraminate lyase